MWVTRPWMSPRMACCRKRVEKVIGVQDSNLSLQEPSTIAAERTSTKPTKFNNLIIFTNTQQQLVNQNVLYEMLNCRFIISIFFKLYSLCLIACTCSCDWFIRSIHISPCFILVTSRCGEQNLGKQARGFTLHLPNATHSRRQPLPLVCFETVTIERWRHLHLGEMYSVVWWSCASFDGLQSSDSCSVKSEGSKSF